MNSEQLRQRPSITAAIIARDEELLIRECLASVAWADEMLVVIDAATRDRTAEVARALGARVETRAFDHFAAQRDHALSLARSEWVLFVDADERVTPLLHEEILLRVKDSEGRPGFWIPRHNYILGRLVRGAGWFPDYQLRLLRRDHAQYDPRRPVHEVALVDGPTGYLQHPLIHLNYRTLGELIAKQERYTLLEAQRWQQSNGRPRSRALLGQPVRELWRRLVTLRGYQEGLLGVMLSLLLAWYAGKAVWLARRGA
jgi:glycosyltransferase involved in cell wall biosynthesis